MVVHMEIKLVIGVKQIKLKDMKFKVINEENNKIIAMNLDIDEARLVARANNRKYKTDIFTISSQLEKPHRNAEEISKVIKREIKELLTNMINKYPRSSYVHSWTYNHYK